MLAARLRHALAHATRAGCQVVVARRPGCRKRSCLLSRPLEFIATRGDNGRPSLDVREAEIEHLYIVQDTYSRLLFIALCREQGATVYRRPRQRVVSICVRTTVSKHNAL